MNIQGEDTTTPYGTDSVAIRWGCEREEAVPDSQEIEWKAAIDLTDRRDRLTLIKEIVAMANGDGGQIQVGVSDDGSLVGVPNHKLDTWDEATLGDLVESFIEPDRLAIEILFKAIPNTDLSVVTLRVPGAKEPPLVLNKVGNYGDPSRTVFRERAVLVRRSSKTEPAKRADFLRWNQELRETIMERVNLVMDAPAGSHIRVIDEDEVRDEPNFQLSRSTDLFNARPENLLDAQTLLYMFKNREDLTISDESTRLLIQSSLRRKATLFFWLQLLSPTLEQVQSIISQALTMRDRDKSDMSTALPEMASHYLDDAGYHSVINQMRRSPYKHLRDAASDLLSRTDAIDRTAKRTHVRIDGVYPSDMSDLELLVKADELASAGESRIRQSRLLPNLGAELFLKRSKVAI